MTKELKEALAYVMNVAYCSAIEYQDMAMLERLEKCEDLLKGGVMLDGCKIRMDGRKVQPQ